MFKQVLFIAMVIMFLMISACSSGSDSVKESGSADPAVEEEETSEEDASETDNKDQASIDKEQAEENEAGSEPIKEDKNSEKMTETGVYNGQADVHTIEIETDDGPTAFQLTIEARDDVEELTVGEEVTYTFHEDGEQLVIEKVEPKQ